MKWIAIALAALAVLVHFGAPVELAFPVGPELHRGYPLDWFLIPFALLFGALAFARARRSKD